MIHFDMDIYSAAYYVFDTLIKYDRLKDTIIVFDELINYYNFEDGEMLALYEMVKKYNLEYEIIGTHGDILSIKDIEKYKSLSFSKIRDFGYFQECAIKIIDYKKI